MSNQKIDHISQLLFSLALFWVVTWHTSDEVLKILTFWPPSPYWNVQSENRSHQSTSFFISFNLSGNMTYFGQGLKKMTFWPLTPYWNVQSENRLHQSTSFFISFILSGNMIYFGRSLKKIDLLTSKSLLKCPIRK